jgi:DNA-binding response OmpR family regulator
MTHKPSLALILEGTELGRWALTHALRAEGFEVTAVETWGEASVWLRTTRFSLVLAAVALAPGSAADLAAEIRRDQPQARVVLLTDQDGIDDLRRACGPGPEILAKPFDLAAVAQVALSRPGPVDQSPEA